MEKDVIMWIIGGIVTLLIAAMGALINAIGRQSERMGGFETKLVRLETIISLWGEKAARVLHSPHTPELDTLLEKYNSGTLTVPDIEKLLGMCEKIETDLTTPREERSLAAFVGLMCHQKLNHPAGQVRTHAN